MARKDRVSMDNQAQILELHRRGYSVRKIAQTLKKCRKSVRKYIARVDKLAPSYDISALKSANDAFQVPKKVELDPKIVILQFPKWLQDLDWESLLTQIRKGISYQVLYKESRLSAQTYWNFWNNLKRLNGILLPEKPKTTMRLVHKAGEKAFVDYGDGINLVDPVTGELTKTWCFVGSLPFSSKVYAEFVFDQKLASFIASHERMWKYFNGVTKYIVCDNLKSAVTKAGLYDPDVNKTFVAYANHAGFAVLPARPRRPKDKANVECHVGILQRTFFQEVRNNNFQFIGELNQSIWVFLAQFNNQIMKEHGASRNDRFCEEASLLQALPQENFVIPEIREATVHPDCHVQFAKAFYSVPWQYVGKIVRVVAAAQQVQIFDILSLERIALHTIAKKLGERKTNDLHWPPEQREHCNFTLERALQDAHKIGPKTGEMVAFLFALPHPLVYLRRIQGWLRQISFSKYTRESMEYASAMAMQHKRFSSSYVNDCANFFNAGGLLRTQKTGAPKRDLNHIYI